MVTLEDIAKEAGVSHSTVSRALAGSHLVNSTTRAKIQAIAGRLGYQVNQVARNLKNQSTCTIGLVVPEVSNPYYPKLIQCIADLVTGEGYSLQLHLSGHNQNQEAECLRLLKSHRADGILLVTAEQGLVAREITRELSRSGTPLVLMGWVENAEDLDLVTGDDYEGGSALAVHLWELGHRHIAIIGKWPHRGRYDRLHGFTETLKQRGVSIADCLHFVATTEDQVKGAISNILSRADRPTAIFATQDSIAAWVYHHLQRQGVHIPGEVSVAGYDDLDLAKFLHPTLTTVGTHIEPLARRMVEVLIDKIRTKGDSWGAEHHVVVPSLLVRESTSVPSWTKKNVKQPSIK